VPTVRHVTAATSVRADPVPFRPSAAAVVEPGVGGYALGMTEPTTDPVTSADTDPAHAQGDQDAEPTMTAPSGPRPDAATDPDPSDTYADKPDAEGDS
jgi:hypothetical protein